MEDVTFTTSGVDRLLLTLKHLKDCSAMQKVEAVKDMSTARVPGNNNRIYYTKTERMMRNYPDSIKGFMQLFS